jgi:starch-binding outer membrane protein, SusD/RagB family
MKNGIIAVFSISLLLFTASCSDWLDQQPIDTVTEDQAWTTGDDAEGAVAKAFTIFRRALAGLTKEDTPSTTRNGAWGDYYFWGDARCGDWITPSDDGDWEACFQNKLISRSELQPLNNWRLYYRAIEQCNLVLEKVPDITEDLTTDRKNQLLAEARFLRAMSHFYAARIWGDVPINLTARNVEALGRSPRDSVMTMVVSELEESLPDLPWTYDGMTRKKYVSRGTKGAALALQADAYMWLGEYQKASDDIQKIIDSDVFELVPISDFREMFDNGNSNEIVFQMYYDADEGEYSGYYGTILTYYLTNPYTSRSNLSLAVARSKILEIFPDYDADGSDLRVPQFFQSIDFSTSSSELRSIYSDPLANGEEQIMFAKYRKDKDRSYDKIACPITVYRYAGLLLLKAEADARLGNLADALANINLVRARAGVSDVASEDQETVVEYALQERRRELIGEFQRCYDLVRLGRLHEFNSYISEEDEEEGAGFFPVDDEAFENNPNMEQTTYWQYNQ